jgi:RNA polymerase sigma factor (sigma-70 family)
MNITSTLPSLKELPSKPLTRVQELDCVKQIESGNPEEADAALERLVMHSLTRAFRYVMSWGNITEGEALSISYSALVKAAGNFRDTSTRFLAYAKPFLRGALAREWKDRAVVTNSWRRRKENETCEVTPLDEALDKHRALVPTTVDFPFDEISDKMRLEQLQKYLRRLTPQEQMVIELFFWGEFSQEQISQLVRCSRKAICSTMKRGLKRLRNFIMDDGMEMKR